MSLLSAYNKKKKTVPELLSLLQDGDYILSAQALAEPVILLEQFPLLHQWGRKNLVFNSCMPVRDLGWYHDPAMRETLEHVCWFFSPPARKAHQEGLCSFLPGYSTNLVRKTFQQLRSQGRRPVLLATASPMDAEGNFSLSISALFEREIIDNGALVLLEVSSRYPRTHGDTTLPLSAVTAFVETDRPVPEMPKTTLRPVDEAIGTRIAELIPDGSTLQLGVGHIPDAVAIRLKDRRHLGIHSGMFSESLMELIRCGAVDNSRKGFHPGETVTAFAAGSEELYRFLHENRDILIKGGYYTNAPAVIAQNRNMVSLNTALEIDLTGQCAAESMGFTQWSATGAQTETVEGAQLSPGGKSILALPSCYTARGRDGEKILRSKIVLSFRPGTIVSTSRNDVDYVVTEYGTAWLRGLSVDKRAKALIAIAHPCFRNQLTADAKKYGLIF